MENEKGPKVLTVREVESVEWQKTAIKQLEADIPKIKAAVEAIDRAKKVSRETLNMVMSGLCDRSFVLLSEIMYSKIKSRWGFYFDK